MKKNASALAPFLFAVILWSCGDNKSSESTTTDTNTTMSGTTGGDTAGLTNNGTTGTGTTGTGTSGSNANMSATPLKGKDSTFVMDAAMSGMMEVEAGRLVEQNGANDRIKQFGAMMVRDHTTANNELKSLASAKGMMLPDSLSGKMRSHVEAMRKMNGKALDRHYINMMQTAHKMDISKFESASNTATDADLKGWAGKQLPVLRMHKDSADAIAKMKM
jgi:putative membrane protein